METAIGVIKGVPAYPSSVYVTLNRVYGFLHFFGAEGTFECVTRSYKVDCSNLFQSDLISTENLKSLISVPRDCRLSKERLTLRPPDFRIHYEWKLLRIFLTHRLSLHQFTLAY